MRENPPLNVSIRPDLASAIPARVDLLCLRVSVWLGILVWNDGQCPARELRPLARSERESRVSLPCSLRGELFEMAIRQAKARRMSRNAYLEALAAADLADPEAPLAIHPRTVRKSRR